MDPERTKSSWSYGREMRPQQESAANTLIVTAFRIRPVAHCGRAVRGPVRLRIKIAICKIVGALCRHIQAQSDTGAEIKQRDELRTRFSATAGWRLERRLRQSRAAPPKEQERESSKWKRTQSHVQPAIDLLNQSRLAGADWRPPVLPIMVKAP